jgi:hypothetical protein
MAALLLSGGLALAQGAGGGAGGAGGGTVGSSPGGGAGTGIVSPTNPNGATVPSTNGTVGQALVQLR